MKYRRRIYYSASQRAEIWDRWQRGESMNSIGRLFDRKSSSVFSVIAPTGGIRPPDRKRGLLALSLVEREEISRGLSTQQSLRAIARLLGRAPSTISREVRRNGGHAAYRATISDQAAWDRGLRPKKCKLACHPPLAHAVSTKLQRKWSPEQIAGWLKRTFPGEAHKQVSHETIYRSLYIQARGVLKKELLEHLRAKRTVRLVDEADYIWLREIPEGFYYSGYAHEGAMWLTIALAFSTFTLGTIFRGELLDHPRSSLLKNLTWISI